MLSVVSDIRYLLAYKKGFSLSRMTYNQRDTVAEAIFQQNLKFWQENEFNITSLLKRSS